MDTMKDTKMQPATDAVIEELRKMQPTAWVYEDMLGRKCVGFERPLHRRNTHEPLFSAATHAVVIGLVNSLEAAEKERDALRAEVQTWQDQAKEYWLKITEMEQQEPVAFGLYSGWALKATYLKDHEACEQRDRRQLTADLSGSLEAYRVVPLYALPGAQAQPAPSVPGINEGVRKVTLDFRWESEAQHHIPTIEIEFDPVSPDSPNDAKGWQDRARIASMLSPEAKP